MSTESNPFEGAGTVYWRTEWGQKAEINKHAAEVLDEDLRAKGWTPWEEKQ